MNMEVTEQEKGQVEGIISRIAEAQGVETEAARKLLHRYGCGGGCDWYKTKSEAAGFQKGGLTDEENAAVEDAIGQVLPGAGGEEVWYVVHGVLCPGHPRKKTS